MLRFKSILTLRILLRRYSSEFL